MKRITMLLGFIALTTAVWGVAIYRWKVETQVDGVVWGKQLGTEKDEGATGVVVDSQGNIYMIGWTEGNLFGTNAGREDIFIAKFSQEGNLIWGKQLGTPEGEIPMDIALDSDGNIYVVGATDGNLFGQVAREFNDDAFVAKFSPKGEVIWSKQFGTPGQDWATGVAVDDKNRVVYVVGFLQIGEFGDPKAEVFEEITYSETFVVKYDFEGNKVYERQYGTEKDDMGFGICVDKDSNVYIVGETTEWFSKRGPGDTDAFVAKLTPEGNLVWGREFGTNDRDYANAVRADKNGNIYIVGVVNTGEIGETKDAFIRKYDGNGNQLWVKEIKTEKKDEGLSIMIDDEGKIYVVGYSEGNLFGSNLGGSDIFIVKYNSVGELIWGEMIGTEEEDEGEDIGIDGQGNIYFVGRTGGNLFGRNLGSFDVFIAKFKR